MPVPGLCCRALWDPRPARRPPFPGGREQRPRSGAGLPLYDSRELKRGGVRVGVCVRERDCLPHPVDVTLSTLKPEWPDQLLLPTEALVRISQRVELVS